MYQVNDIEINDVTHPRTGEVLETVKKIHYTILVYNDTTGMYNTRVGKILVGVGYEAPTIDGLGTRYQMPGGNRHFYDSDLVIMTNFIADYFKIEKNRWGHDGNVFNKGLNLGQSFIYNLEGFEISSRGRLWEAILQCMIDITGHPRDFIMDKEKYIMGSKLNPKYTPKRLKFE
jgi:hypothetical protein